MAPEDQIGPIGALAIPATDYPRALRVRHKTTTAMATLLASFDAIVAPAHPRTTAMIGAPIDEEPNEPVIRTIGEIANLCGLPGLCLPAGPGRAGLPTAVVLTGPADGDAAPLAAGIAYQSRTGWQRPRPMQGLHDEIPTQSTSVSI